MHLAFLFQNEFRSSSSVHVQLQRHLMESDEPGVVVVVVDDEPGGGEVKMYQRKTKSAQR